MKIKPLFFALMLCSSMAYSQSLKWSQPLEEPSVKAEGLHIRLLPSYHHLDESTQQLYSLRKDGQLTVFDQEMKLLKTQNISFTDERYPKMEIERAITVGNQMVLILTGKQKGSNDTDVFAQKLNKEKLQLETEKHPLTTYAPKSEFGVVDTKVLAHNIDIYDNRICFTTSPNKQLFLLTFPGKVQGREESCHISVFDTSLKSVWAGDIEMPRPDGQIAINGYEVDDFGNVYIAGEDIKSFQKGVYKVFIFNKQKLLKEHDISHVEGKRLFDMSIDASDDMIQCAGFYANPKTSGYSGVAHVAIDPKSLEITSETYTPFSENIQEEFMSSGEKKKKAKGIKIPDVEIENYTDKGCIATKDGGVILLAEYNGIGKVHIASTESYTFDGYYAQYGDIIAIKLNNVGKTMWSHIIRKTVQEINIDYRIVDYASFQYTTINDQLYIYFNEFADKKTLNHVLVTIDMEGKKKRQVLASNTGKISKDELPWIVPVWSGPIGKSSIFIYNAYSDEQYRLGIMKP